MTPNDLEHLMGVGSQENVSDRLFHKISHLILSGELDEGYTFPNETVLCEQLKVGRTSLREAYKALELSGYVTRSKRGTVVNSRSQILNATPLYTVFSEAPVRDFNEYRLMLETTSAELAAKNATMDDIIAMSETIQQSVHFWAEKDMEALLLMDRQFHRQVAETSKNVLLSTTESVMADAYKAGIRRNFLFALKNNPRSLDLILSQHQRILDAIRSGDSAGARSAMEAHLSFVACD